MIITPSLLNNVRVSGHSHFQPPKIGPSPNLLCQEETKTHQNSKTNIYLIQSCTVNSLGSRENRNCLNYLWYREITARAFARLRPMCPGFDSRTRRHIVVEFVVWGCTFENSHRLRFPTMTLRFHTVFT